MSCLLHRFLDGANTVSDPTKRYLVTLATGQVASKGRPSSTSEVVNLCTPSPPPPTTTAAQRLALPPTSTVPPRQAPRWQTDNTRRQATPGPSGTTGLAFNAPERVPLGNRPTSAFEQWRQLSAGYLEQGTHINPQSDDHRRQHIRLTTDSPSEASEKHSVDSRSASVSFKSPTATRRSKRKRSQRVGTHTRFDTSDEDQVSHTTATRSRSFSQSASSGLSPRIPRQRVHDDETVDLDGMSLPSQLGSRSPSSDGSLDDSSHHHARLPTSDSPDSAEQELVTLDSIHEADVHMTYRSDMSDFECNCPIKRSKYVSTPAASSSDSEPSSHPHSSALARGAKQLESHPNETGMARGDEGGESEADDVRSKRTSLSDARNHSFSFNPTALTETLQTFLNHAQSLGRAQLGQELAGSSSRARPCSSLTGEALSVAPHHVPLPHQTEKRSLSSAHITEGSTNGTTSHNVDQFRTSITVTAPHPSPPFNARIRQVRALEVPSSVPASAPTPRAPTPGAPTTRFQSANFPPCAPTPGSAPTPPLLIVTSPPSSAPTPFAPPPSVKMTSTATQTDSVPTSNGNIPGNLPSGSHQPQANGKTHPRHSTQAGGPDKSCGTHTARQHPCTACSCVVANLMSNIMHWIHDAEWFTCECEQG